MSEELLTDDQSHYEVSLTAGQAFLAFVLLLLSLAASFAFGLVIGRGQADERLVVKKEPAVINEAGTITKKSSGRIVELGVKDDDFKGEADAKPSDAAPVVTEEGAATNESPAPAQDSAAAVAKPAADAPHSAATPPATTSAAVAPAPAAAAKPPQQPAAAPSTAPVPHYAQLLSSADQKTAESLAAKLIDKGFTSAYVERGVSPKGPIFKVRVKFGSEAEARAAEPKLREFSQDVWITTK